MFIYIEKQKRNTLAAFAVKLTAFALSFLIAFGPSASYAQSLMPIPQAGGMVSLSPVFHPAVIKGLQIFPDNPFRFDFILDTGDSGVQNDPERAKRAEGSPLKGEADKLIKYFLAALTVPEKNLWVNLSPYEKDRVIPDDFGQTDMGRDLLAQDYLLKQITASLIHPESDLGKQFWNKIYEKANRLYGTSEIPVDVLHRVWIVPAKAVVYEKPATGSEQAAVFVTKSRLKVLLEEEYFQQTKGQESESQGLLSADAVNIIKQIIIPELEKEVNEGRNFAVLRQIYHSLILATWFKKRLKESLLGKAYADQSKTNGIDIDDKNMKEKIYAQYLKAFKDGVYSFIKEEYDKDAKALVARKYFSGGVVLNPQASGDFAITTDETGAYDANGKTFRVSTNLLPRDAAMVAEKPQEHSSLHRFLDDCIAQGGRPFYGKDGVLEKIMSIFQIKDYYHLAKMVGYSNITARSFSDGSFPRKASRRFLDGLISHLSFDFELAQKLYILGRGDPSLGPMESLQKKAREALKKAQTSEEKKEIAHQLLLDLIKYTGLSSGQIAKRLNISFYTVVNTWFNGVKSRSKPSELARLFYSSDQEKQIKELALLLAGIDAFHAADYLFQKVKQGVMTHGELIYQIRTQREQTQEEFAKSMKKSRDFQGISHSVISNMEQDGYTVDEKIAVAVAKHLGFKKKENRKEFVDMILGRLYSYTPGQDLKEHLRRAINKEITFGKLLRRIINLKAKAEIKYLSKLLEGKGTKKQGAATSTISNWLNGAYFVYDEKLAEAVGEIAGYEDVDLFNFINIAMDRSYDPSILEGVRRKIITKPEGLKQLREKMKLSTREMSSALHVSKNKYLSMEKCGYIQDKYLDVAAKKLQVPEDDKESFIHIFSRSIQIIDKTAKHFISLTEGLEQLRSYYNLRRKDVAEILGISEWIYMFLERREDEFSDKQIQDLINLFNIPERAKEYFKLLFSNVAEEVISKKESELAILNDPILEILAKIRPNLMSRPEALKRLRENADMTGDDVAEASQQLTKKMYVVRERRGTLERQYALELLSIFRIPEARQENFMNIFVDEKTAAQVIDLVRRRLMSKASALGHFRKNVGLSKKEVANTLGITPKKQDEYERKGFFPEQYMDRLAKTYQISPNQKGWFKKTFQDWAMVSENSGVEKDALFSPEQAEVYTKTKEGALKVSDDVWFPGEKDVLLDMLFKPLKNKQDILARQKAVDQLTGQGPDKIKDLQKMVNDIHQWHQTYKYLTEIEEEEYSWGRDMPRRQRNLDKLIQSGIINKDTFGEDIQKVKEYETASAEWKRDHGKPFEEKKINELQKLARISDYKDAARMLAEEIKKIGGKDGIVLNALAKELQGKIDRMHVPDLFGFMKIMEEKDQGSLGRLFDGLKSLTSSVSKIAAFLTFSHLVIEEGYARVGSDDSKPAGYKKGWLFIKRKKAQKYSYTDKKEKDQVLNDGPADALFVALTGSNAAGKTHYLKQNLFIQLLWQSFGYVPAQEANNLPVYGHIVYLGQPGASGRADLSGFEQELRNWKPVVDRIGKNSVIFVDEGYSRTSPEDQAEFLSATKKLAKDRGARVMAATHNETFTETLEGDKEVQIYHFEVDVKDQEITYTHKRREGFDDSHALEVARARGLPERIIQRAQKFLDGESTAAAPRPEWAPVPVVRYTEEEREALKQKTGDFLGFFPSGNALDMIGGEKEILLGKGELEWRYDDPERGNSPFGGKKEKKKYYSFDPVVRIFSDDEDFGRFSPIVKNGLGGIVNQDYLRAIQRIFMQAPSRDSREILERQKMFQELVSLPERRVSIYKVLAEVEGLMNALLGRGSIDGAPQWERFNLQFLDGAVPKASYFSGEYKNDVDVFLGILRLNLKMTGRSEKDIGVQEDVEKNRELAGVYEKYNVLYEEYKDRNVRESQRDVQESSEQDGAWKTWNKEIYVPQMKEIKARFLEMTGEEGAQEWRGSEHYLLPLSVRPLNALMGSVNARVQAKIPALSFFNKDIWPSLRKEMEELYPVVQKHFSGQRLTFPGVHIVGLSYLDSLLSEKDWVQQLGKELRSFDSVHLHQFSYYLEGLLRHWLGGITSGADYLEKRMSLSGRVAEAEAQLKRMEKIDLKYDSKKTVDFVRNHMDVLQEIVEELKQKQKQEKQDRWKAEEINHKLKMLYTVQKAGKKKPVNPAVIFTVARDFILKREIARLEQAKRRLTDEVESFNEDALNMIRQETFKLRALLGIAEIIDHQEWHPGTLADKLEIDMTAGWNLMKEKKAQVPLSLAMNDGERIRLYSGSTMAGKTFSGKTPLWNIMSVLSTGYGPNAGLRIPGFDRVIFIDCSSSREGNELSSFEQEMEYWKEFFKNIDKEKGPFFVIIDEPGSTTSPRYQAAISYAIAEELLERGHFVTFISHNHVFFKAFQEINGRYTKTYHPRTRVDIKGKPIFDREIDEGHEPSNSIRVAEAMGLTEITKYIKDEALLTDPRSKPAPDQAMAGWIDINDAFLNKIKPLLEKHVFEDESGLPERGEALFYVKPEEMPQELDRSGKNLYRGMRLETDALLEILKNKGLSSRSALGSMYFSSYPSDGISYAFRPHQYSQYPKENFLSVIFHVDGSFPGMVRDPAENVFYTEKFVPLKWIKNIFVFDRKRKEFVSLRGLFSEDSAENKTSEIDDALLTDPASDLAMTGDDDSSPLEVNKGGGDLNSQSFDWNKMVNVYDLLEKSFLDYEMYADRLDFESEGNGSFISTNLTYDHLEKIFEEIIKNALDEQPEGQIKVRLFQDKNDIVVEVMNEGEVDYKLLKENAKKWADAGLLYKTEDGRFVIKKDFLLEPGKPRQVSVSEAGNILDKELPFIEGLSKGKAYSQFGKIGKGLEIARRWVKTLSNGTVDLESKNGYTKVRVQIPTASSAVNVQNPDGIDFAQTASSEARGINAFLNDDVGGIDLNPNNWDIETQGQGIKFNLPDDLRNLDPAHISGFTPVIINIVPIPDLAAAFGAG